MIEEQKKTKFSEYRDPFEMNLHLNEKLFWLTPPLPYYTN
jgi:hypothetical protein